VKLRLLPYLAAVLFAVALTSAFAVPDLVGEWSCTMTGHIEGQGYVEVNQTGVLNISITEQIDRHFRGNITTLYKNGTKTIEGFSGIIDSDNTTLYIAEYDKGYAIGKMISNDSIEYFYLEDGDANNQAKTVLDTLYRIKNETKKE
jgi:hypothetical protein